MLHMIFGLPVDLIVDSFSSNDNQTLATQNREHLTE